MENSEWDIQRTLYSARILINNAAVANYSYEVVCGDKKSAIDGDEPVY